MAVRASVTRFPGNLEAQERAGVAWGISVTPFAAVDERGNQPVLCSDGHLLPRCENCWAYLNALCEMEQWAWTCSLCASLNALSAPLAAHYSNPESCPELSSSFVDFELQDDGSTNGESLARPVYVAAVDLTGFIQCTLSDEIIHPDNALRSVI